MGGYSTKIETSLIKGYTCLRINHVCLHFFLFYLCILSKKQNKNRNKILKELTERISVPVGSPWKQNQILCLFKNLPSYFSPLVPQFLPRGKHYFLSLMYPFRNIICLYINTHAYGNYISLIHNLCDFL